MKAFTCDRCGAYFSNNDDLPKQPSYLLNIFSKEDKRFYIADLCSPCYKKLEEWVEDPKNEELPFE